MADLMFHRTLLISFKIVYDDDDKPIARGVIATPFDVKPFQVSFLDCDNEPAGAHYTWECSTTYSKEDELVSSNPISGGCP
jgi:hypothetical protein